MDDVQFAKTAEFWSRLDPKTVKNIQKQAFQRGHGNQNATRNVGMNTPSVLLVILV